MESHVIFEHTLHLIEAPLNCSSLDGWQDHENHKQFIRHIFVRLCPDLLQSAPGSILNLAHHIACLSAQTNIEGDVGGWCDYKV